MKEVERGRKRPKEAERGRKSVAQGHFYERLDESPCQFAYVHDLFLFRLKLKFVLDQILHAKL